MTAELGVSTVASTCALFAEAPPAAGAREFGREVVEARPTAPALFDWFILGAAGATFGGERGLGARRVGL